MPGPSTTAMSLTVFGGIAFFRSQDLALELASRRPL
jgi:hypothetical protein